MCKLYFSVAAILFSICSTAQSQQEIPLMRRIFHDKINESQVSVDKLDRRADKLLNAGTDEDINQQISYALYHRVDELQNLIEADTLLNGNNKIKFLRGLDETLALYESAYRNRQIKAVQLPIAIDAYTAAMQLDKQGKSISPVIADNEVSIGEIIVRSFAFQNNNGLAEANNLLILKACNQDHDKILPILRRNPDFAYADSLIKLVAYKNQEDIYTYAQSANSALGRRINNLDDPLVKVISCLAKLNSGRLYFPFLDDLYKGKKSMEDVEKNLGDDFKFYRMLVNTQIDYADRLRKRDTPMAMPALTSMLRKKAIEVFITVINTLHDSPDAVRMKKVETLNPQELYYLCVMGETEIYTSSYLKVYDRIFQRMKNPSSDSLLMSVNFDYFKKFIKMSAGYNTLNNFLGRMGKDNAVVLMKAFVNGLEKTGNLEDAVDVADSYASISDDSLRALILGEVQKNLNTLTKSGDHRGANIYEIMNSIFLSIDSTNHIDISAKYGIPGVYSINAGSLKDSSGRIIIQQFFYGDKDGNTVFRNFIGAYSNANWRIVSKPEWIEVSSTKGTPVTIYGNRPLDEVKDLDAQAQAHLSNYLGDNGFDPTIVIHRGHSYYVKYTINQLAPSAKVVLLGSCGGYHNLKGVLEVCPFAHIIASKQVGSGTVNQPMIVNITETLRQGKDLNWPAMWKDFGKRFEKNELFDDYVPPHKNLGAIFIMAYNTLEERAEG